MLLWEIAIGTTIFVLNMTMSLLVNNLVFMILSVLVCYTIYWIMDNLELKKLTGRKEIDEYKPPICNKIIVAVYSVLVVMYTSNIVYIVMLYILFIIISASMRLIKEYRVEVTLKPFRGKLLTGNTVNLMFKTERVMCIDLTKFYIEYGNSIILVCSKNEEFRYVLVPSNIRNRTQTYDRGNNFGSHDKGYTNWDYKMVIHRGNDKLTLAEWKGLGLEVAEV